MLKLLALLLSQWELWYMLEELESLTNHFFYSPCPVPACAVIPSHNFIEVRAESFHFPSYSCKQDHEFNILLQLAILLL